MRFAGSERAALDLDLERVADLVRADHDLEGRAGDLGTLLLDGHQVLTDLTGRERDTWRIIELELTFPGIERMSVQSNRGLG